MSPSALKALIIEDSEDDAELLARTLQRGGYEVTYERVDEAAALQAALKRQHWDITFSDFSVPGFDAMAALALVREHDPDMPLIIVSGTIGEETAVAAMKNGAHDYFIKGNLARLLPAVQRELREAERRREHRRGEQAREDSDERFRLLVGGTKDYAIFLLDTGGRVTSWNEGAERVTGYRAEEAVGQHLSCFYTAEDVRNGRPERGLMAAVASGQAESEGWQVRKDGTQFWGSEAITALRGEDGQLRGYSNVTRDITERKNAEDRLRYEATHDSLTNLPNRALFMEHLRRTIARANRDSNSLFAVLFLDLDRFKVINDSLGHVVADQLLIAIARKLEMVVRPHDVVARFGGDEFVILLENIRDVGDVTHATDRIYRGLAGPFNLEGHEAFVTVSIGVAMSSPQCHLPEDYLRDADMAMYRAKTLGRGRYQIFEQSMHDCAMTLLQLETDLQRALERREFAVHYQPIISLETKRLIGFEALARWQHPQRGLLSPQEFIPTAEENGLIIQIDEWVLHEACRQVRVWQEQFAVAQPLAINVNLSGRHFSQPGLLERIKGTLRDTGVDARCLNLEMTESVVMQNAEAATGVLSQLKELGVNLYIDDFGTGYSSLSYLHSFPIDALKIDRSFVGQMHAEKKNLEIVRTIVALAQNLNMAVVAEGVETAEQLALLKQLTCDHGQGYLFSEPMNAQAVAALISPRESVGL